MPTTRVIPLKELSDLCEVYTQENTILLVANNPSVPGEYQLIPGRGFGKKDYAFDYKEKEFEIDILGTISHQDYLTRIQKYDLPIIEPFPKMCFLQGVNLGPFSDALRTQDMIVGKI
jgi:hypothetical protein